MKIFAIPLLLLTSLAWGQGTTIEAKTTVFGGTSILSGLTAAATPTFSPSSGTYASTQSVTISTATGGCSGYIYWNLTGINLIAGTNGTSVSVTVSETVYAQVIGCPGYGNSAVSSAVYVLCIPPTMTVDYDPNAISGLNYCGAAGTSACTNGATVYTQLDVAGSNNATQSTNADQPTFNTNQLNGLPALSFNGTTDFMNMTTAVSNTQYTFYAVGNFTALSSFQLIFGCSSAGCLGYGMDSAKQSVYQLGSSNQDNTISLSTATWYTIAVTFNTSTLAYTFYGCSGGTCTAQGTGTYTGATFSNSINEVGSATFTGGTFVTGKIARQALLLGSTSVAGIGAYSSCKYGI